MEWTRERLTPAEAAALDLAPSPPTGYHALTPLTKGTVALAAALGSFASGGFLIPAVLLALLVVPGALAARVGTRTARLALLVAVVTGLPVAVVSMLARSGMSVEAADLAARIILRVAVSAAALIVFGLTTDVRALVADLASRSPSPHRAFVATAAVFSIPRMIERGRAIQRAQGSRALETEGSIVRRVRGVLAAAGPVVLSSFAEVGERSLALEARAFERPGARNLLWAPADTRAQRALRTVLLVASLALIVAGAAGRLSSLP